MKKILCTALVALSFAGSASAATQVSTSDGGMAVRGGADDTTAAAAPTPLIKFSSGVYGLVNFTATDKTSKGYVIAARHQSGSKDFATSNTKTNIFWKQASATSATVTPEAALKADVGTADETGNTFAPGNGWTSY